MRKTSLLFGLTMLGMASVSLPASDSVKSLAKEIKGGLKSTVPIRLAVMPFPYSRDRMSTGSHLVSERLVTYLVQDGLQVVERRFLDQLLEEKKFSQSGIVDAAALKEARIQGVAGIVTGTLSDNGERSTEVMARVIQVETGEILCAARAVMPRVWLDDPKLPRIAQSRSPVPVAAPNLELEQGQPDAAVQRPAPGKRQRYTPAPVPFVMPGRAR